MAKWVRRVAVRGRSSSSSSSFFLQEAQDDCVAGAAFAEIVPPPSPSTILASQTFHKPLLLSSHRLLQLYYHHLALQALRSAVSLSQSAVFSWTPPPSTPCFAPLSCLPPLKIRDLTASPNHPPNSGRALYGTLCVDPVLSGFVKRAFVRTVLEDDSGAAVRLIIFSPATPKMSFDDARSRFPKGANVVIKEPFFARGPDDTMGVQVSHPANLVILSSASTPLVSES